MAGGGADVLRSGQGPAAAWPVAGRPVAVADLTEDPAALGFSATTAIRAYLKPLRVKSGVRRPRHLPALRYEFNPEEVELLPRSQRRPPSPENRRSGSRREQARTLQRSFCR